MKLYNEWMTDYNYFGDNYNNNKLLDDAIYRFEQQKQSLEGKDALVDGVAERIVVQNHTNPLNASKYDKKCSFNIISKVHTGSLVEFDEKKWVVVSRIFSKTAYKVGSVLECNNTITMNKNHVLYQIPCVVEGSVRLNQLGLEENKYFSEPSSTKMIRVQNNDITLGIKRSDIYKIGRQNYKIVDIDDISEPGILILKAEFALDEQPSNSIITVTILNGDEVNMNYQGQTLQLNTEVKIDGDIISNPIITYTSSNIEIATVSNTGLITTVLNGLCTITATYNGVSDSIIINGVTTIPDDFEIVLTPTNSNTVKIGTSLTLEAYAMNNGTEDLTKHFTWSLSNVDRSNNVYATIVGNDKTGIITASNSYKYINKYIKIKVTLSDNINVFEERQIKLISLI
jgi:hypothetical protein